MMSVAMWEHYVSTVFNLLQKFFPLLRKASPEEFTVEQLTANDSSVRSNEVSNLERVLYAHRQEGNIGIVWALQWIYKLRDAIHDIGPGHLMPIDDDSLPCGVQKVHHNIRRDTYNNPSLTAELNTLLRERITYPMISKLDLILVTNDDGYGSIGIKILTDIATILAKRVVVVAPQHNQSGRSHSTGLYEKIEVIRMEEDRFRLTGTTVDCVAWALGNLFANGEHIDVVLSGINCGQNYGDDMRYSSTFAGAVEAYAHALATGRIAVCISMSQVVGARNEENFGCSKRHGLEIIARIIEGMHPDASDRTGRLFNVNFPCTNEHANFKLMGHDDKMNTRSTILSDEDLATLSDGQCTGAMYGLEDSMDEYRGQEHVGLFDGDITITQLGLPVPVQHPSLKFECNSLVLNHGVVEQLDLILVINDEGPGPGLGIAVSIAQKLAKRMIVVVPKNNNRRSSQAVTLTGKIEVMRISEDYYCVNGTPADCVIIAFSSIVPNTKVDLLICGVGHGNSIENDLLYSGIFGAAMEGLMWGLTGRLGVSMALYMPKPNNIFYIEKLCKMGPDVAAKVVQLGNSFEERTGRKVCFNVNFPEEILPSSKMVLCDSQLQICFLPTLKQVAVSGDARYFEYAEDTSLNQEDNPSSEMTNLKAGNIVIRAYEFNYNMTRSGCSL